MSINNPKVSIIIPVYNGSNFMGEAIDSALAQTYKNIEIIVVNDGSNDKGATEEIAKSYGNKIRYYSKENGGVSTALNIGIAKMTGEYFSWLSHDDKYNSDKIEKQVKFLRTLEIKNVILFSNYAVMDEDGRFDYNCVLNHEMLEKTPIYALLRGNVNGITMLIPKTAFEEYGEFDPELRCTQDYDMWYRMIKTYKFIHLNDILSITRVHSRQDTQANPKAISESNTLWIGMVDGLTDIEKIKTEGSLLGFYLEMIKFLRQTPYFGAIEFCERQLEGVVQSNTVGADSLKNTRTIFTTYELLAASDEKRAAAYYLENIVKMMVRKAGPESAASIISEVLVGENIGIDKKSIEEKYVSRILKKTKKPRLMFCSGQWLTGGMERVMSILFDQLKDEYEIFLLTAYDGRQGKIDIPEHVTHIKMSVEYFWSSFDCRVFSHALIFDIDIAIGFMNLFNGQLDFYELCAGTRIKTIASNHEIYFYPYSNPLLFEVIQKRINAYKKVSSVLWLTNFSAAAYGLAANNSYLMPNPNTYKVQKNTKIGDDKTILCVGRFNDYIKRIDRMLKCFSIVLKTHPDANLVLVGKCDRSLPIRPGNDDETTINDLIKRLNIDEARLNFVGEVEDVENYYSQAKLLLLTSINEGFGMVINEAACFGVPTVANRIPGLEDLITDGANGYLTDQDDVESMANRVNRILSDNELRETLSSNAKKMVTRFDEVEIGKKWKYLIDIILKDGPDAKAKLSKELAYHIHDYEHFSKLLFDEISNVINVSYHERNELIKPKFQSTKFFVTKRAKDNYQRFRRTIETKGITHTGKIIAKKTYHKTRRLYKRP